MPGQILAPIHPGELLLEEFPEANADQPVSSG